LATVRYLVKDVDDSIAFYKALGFTVAERWGPPFAMMRLGDLTLWLSGPASSAARTLSDGSVPQPGGWNRLVIEVPDIKSAMDALRKAGADFRSENLVELFEARRE
jgi:catechol 2,3-dioxygenase-like lactoylglutathione lyase family enzyme